MFLCRQHVKISHKDDFGQAHMLKIRSKIILVRQICLNFRKSKFGTANLFKFFAKISFKKKFFFAKKSPAKIIRISREDVFGPAEMLEFPAKIIFDPWTFLLPVQK